MNKINTGNKIIMEQLLEFEVAFPNEKPLTVEQYLSGGNRDIILNSAAFFLGFKNHRSKYSDNKEFLGMFFQKENNDLANLIYDRIKEVEKKGSPIRIINTYSSLKLFEYYFSKPNETETQTKSEFEVNLFKAYLVLNSDFTKKQSVAFPSSQESDKELKMPMMMFCMQYPISDKTNYDINQVWATQTIKSIYLFQFLESHEKTQALFEAFLEHFNCTTWQDYLKKLLPLTLSAIKNDNEAHTDITVKTGDYFAQDCAFVDKLIIQETDEQDQNDFLTLRAKPFYKISEGVYRIIYNLFVVEKIFKGAYFLLRDINKTLPKENRIKEIRSFYGNEISEQVICYKAIESIYSDNCIKYSGKELSDMKIDGAPDYYIRKSKNILLVESKDFLIAADKKMSFDFNVYEEEFGRILDYEEMPNGKIKSKAVMQLINSIRRVLKKEFSFDTDYHYKDIFIYPVLLTHDHQYDTPGFNELIDFWFQDALLELQSEGLFIHNVKPLSVVNIDSIIYNQHGLANNISLHDILDIYQKNKLVDKKQRKFKSQEEYDSYIEDYKEKLMSKLIPFSKFIETYFQENGFWKLPPLVETVAPSLFLEEYEKQKEDKESTTTQ
jgi:hypothetical protein